MRLHKTGTHTELSAFDMEYRDHSGRWRKFLISAGFVLAVAAGGGTYVMMQYATAKAAGNAGPSASVVFARSDLPVSAAIGADSLEVRAVPLDDVVPGSLSKVEDAAGRVTAVPVVAGQPVTRNMLTSTATGETFGLFAATENPQPGVEYRGVSMNVPDERAVGGMLKAGQRVDVLVTLAVAAGGGATADSSTNLMFADVPVIARSGPMYVVRLTLPEATEVSHLLASGDAAFSFVLRGAGDDAAVAEDLGTTTREIVREYELPTP
jgi:Flp pilus assembly protein CpaB